MRKILLTIKVFYLNFFFFVMLGRWIFWFNKLCYSKEKNLEYWLSKKLDNKAIKSDFNRLHIIIIKKLEFVKYYKLLKKC